jgi:hypothetical protein
MATITCSPTMSRQIGVETNEGRKEEGRKGEILNSTRFITIIKVINPLNNST